MKRSEKETKVFAMILDDNVYIGRTTAQKVSAVCYSHYRGKHEQTADCFGTSIRRPDLYILGRITAHSVVTYHYVVAWVHVFIQAGYRILNCGDVIDHATDLYPETAVIVDEILAVPLEEQLAHTHCARYTDADSCPASNQPRVHKESTPEPANAKLTIRLTETEKRKFDQVARSLRLTHRETLQYLIGFSPEEDIFLSILMQNHDKKMSQQKKRIGELEESLTEQRKRLAQQVELHKKYVTMVQRGLSEFMQFFESTSAFPLAIEVEWYDDYMCNCQTDFAYPAKSGVALIRPIAVLRGHGRNPALFILGVTTDGQCIKLRYYPKREYVGIFLTNPTFGVRGSSWLVGWQKAEENVMQLMFAMPLQIGSKYNNPMDAHERLEKITGQFLDDVE